MITLLHYHHCIKSAQQNNDGRKNMDMNVEHDAENQIFYITIKNVKAYLQYDQIDDKTLDYKHTFVPKELRNQGLAGKIVDYALQYARVHGFSVIPSCPFVEKYIERHPQYEALLKS